MARPIAPTPTLEGRAARKFMDEIGENRKASPEEIERMRQGAERIRKMVNFNF